MIDTAVGTLAQHAVEVAKDAAGSAKDHAVEAAKDVAKGAVRDTATRAVKPAPRRLPKLMLRLLLLAGVAGAVYFVIRKRQQQSDEVVPDTFGDAVERERRAGVVATPGA